VGLRMQWRGRHDLVGLAVSIESMGAFLGVVQWDLNDLDEISVLILELLNNVFILLILYWLGYRYCYFD
jgi:hypothetical protein